MYSWDSNRKLLPNPLDARIFNFHETKTNQNPFSVHICKLRSLLHHTPINMISSCTNGYIDYLISTKQKKIKTCQVHLSSIYSWDSNQNLFANPLDARLFNFHETKQNQNLLMMHVNFTTSPHSNQSDFSGYEWMCMPFNFHKKRKSKPTMVQLSLTFSKNSSKLTSACPRSKSI